MFLRYCVLTLPIMICSKANQDNNKIKVMSFIYIVMLYRQETHEPDEISTCAKKMHNFAKKICGKGLWHDDGSIPCRNMSETAFPASLQTERCWKRCFCVLSGGSRKENNVTGLFRREFINGNNVVVTKQSILTTETVFPQYSNNVYAFGFSTISRCLSIYWWIKLHHGERGSEIAWVVFSFSVV